MWPLSDAIWTRGLTWEAYRAGVERNAAVFDEAFASPGYRPEDLDVLRRLPPLRVLAIGEDWCPDVYHTLPTWARAVQELAGWSLRIFPRDAHPGLMEHFLWKGSARRIPVYAFLDGDGRLQAWWSGRGHAAQREVDGFLAGRSFGDLSPEDKRKAGELLDAGYRREYRRANFLEVLALLRAFFHLGRGEADRSGDPHGRP